MPVSMSALVLIVAGALVLVLVAPHGSATTAQRTEADGCTEYVSCQLLCQHIQIRVVGAG